MTWRDKIKWHGIVPDAARMVGVRSPDRACDRCGAATVDPGVHAAHQAGHCYLCRRCAHRIRQRLRRCFEHFDDRSDTD
jgi:hypothetical protein